MRPLDSPTGMIAYRFSLSQTETMYENCTSSIDGNTYTALGFKSVPDSRGRRCRSSFAINRDLDRHLASIGFGKVHRFHADGNGGRRLR